MWKLSEILPNTPVASPLSENTPAYHGLKAEENLKPVSNSQERLILLLKSYFFMSDDFIVRVAPAIGISVENLTGMADKLRELRVERDEETRRLQEQLHTQYYRYVAYQRQLETHIEDLERAYTRYASIKQRLADINQDASNRQIAEALGTPEEMVNFPLYADRRAS
jgi:DNA repair exonuclease SbcCD ATPase subunit